MAALGSDLRSEMATLGSDLRSEMATSGSDLRSEIGGVRVEVERLRGDVERGLRQQLVTVASLNAVMLTVALGFASVLG